MQHKLALVFLMIFYVLPRSVAAEDTVATLFDAGQYATIAAMDAASLSRADRLIQIRSQLILARFYYRGDERITAIETAREKAEAIIANDPENADALMQLGIAWGFMARYQDKAKYARNAGEYLRQAAALNPESGEAQAVLGAWHGEAVARAGGLMARLILGARRKHMEDLFAKSDALSPENIPILTGRAETHMRLGKKEDLEAAQALLTHVADLPPKTALDRLIQAFALHLEAILAADNMDDVKERIDNFHPQAF